MRKTMLAATAVIAAAMLGCIPSLHSLFTDKDLVVEPALAGTWTSDDGKTKFTFKPKSDSKAYELVCEEKEHGTATLEARVGRIGKHLIADTAITDYDNLGIKTDIAKFHLVPTRLFTRIAIEGDTLRYATLNVEWLKKGIEEKKLTIAHALVNDMLVLTATTADLQAFLAKHADDSGAFQEPHDLKR